MAPRPYSERKSAAAFAAAAVSASLSCTSTGAALSLIHISDSDAPRNLLDAFRTAADRRAGVYAVMNGQILHGSHVFKQH